jgi:serine/threonine protein phosphatase 1
MQEGAIPDGTLVYAIGDVHGRADLLDELLGKVEPDALAHDADRRILLFVGDYIDRGPDSAGVIERITRGLPQGFEALCLKGNHEAMMLDFLARPERLGLWLHNGAITTLASYGLAYDDFAAHPDGGADCRDALARAMPGSHHRFFNELRLSAEIGDYFFVHAGVRPGVALDAQDPEDLVWIREEFLGSRADFGKVVIHGHTPVEAPEVRPNRIGIDTGAWQTGVLTALRLYGQTRGFLDTQ